MQTLRNLCLHVLARKGAIGVWMHIDLVTILTGVCMYVGRSVHLCWLGRQAYCKAKSLDNSQC